MEILVSNIVGRTTRRNVNGREVIIAPLSLIVPGVLAGSQGPIFYPPEETARNVAAWNGMPLVVYHPTDNNGEPISAWDDSVVSIGVVKNAQMRAGRLVAEGWFDVATTKATDSRTYAAIENGKPMELSTGLFLDQELAPRGAIDAKGRPYRFIARNYRPDHVAILPDQIGACSQRDGCGLNINRVREADYGTLFHKVTVNGSSEWVEAETENCGCPDKEACNCEGHMDPVTNDEVFESDEQRHAFFGKIADKEGSGDKGGSEKEKGGRGKKEPEAQHHPILGKHYKTDDGKIHFSKKAAKEHTAKQEKEKADGDKKAAEQKAKDDKLQKDFEAARKIADAYKDDVVKELRKAGLKDDAKNVSTRGLSARYSEEGVKVAHKVFERHPGLKKLGFGLRTTNEAIEFDDDDDDEELAMNLGLPEKVSIWQKLGAMLGLNAGATQYKCPESGKWLPYGAGTGKGEPHKAAKEGHAGLMEGATPPAEAAKEGASTEKDEEEEPITSNTEGESTMDRKATIAYLTTNCGVWKGEEATLEKFSDEQLKKLKINAEKAKANEAVANAVREASGDDSLALNAMPAFIKAAMDKKKKGSKAEDAKDGGVDDDEETPVENDKPATNSAELAALRAQVATLTANEEKRNRKEKVELVRRLTANLEGNPEARKARGLKLMKESIESLQDRLLDMPAPTRNREEEQDASDLDFSGAGVGIAANSEDDGEPLVPPTINWSELSSEHNKRRA